jgi:thiol-disulfide isomerase/thioredoxin
VSRGYRLFVAVTLAAGSIWAAGAARKAPELAFNVPGQGQKLLSQYRGKVVALEFILTTCSHCQDASRVMTRYQKELGPRGFQALDLAINALDNSPDPNNANVLVSNFIRDFQVGFPVGWVTRDQFMAFMGFSVLDRVVVPQIVLIDRKGMIRYETPAGDSPERESLMKEGAIREHIEELLSLSDAHKRAH